MTTLHRLPSPNGSGHPAYSKPLAKVESRKRLVLTDRAHRLGVVLMAGGTGGAFGIIFGAATVDHPGAVACGVVVLVGSVLWGGRR